MVFGSCCILIKDDLRSMKAKSVKIEGEQRGLLTNFEVTQTFTHSEKEPQEVHYVFPNDLKICIYDTTFVVGEEIIKPKLQSKEEAKKTYKEAVDAGRTAVYGSNIGYGMTEFKLGNVPPETECKVILKIAFTAQVTKEKSFFIKFPIDVYTPSGSKGCLDVNSSHFSFQIQADKDKIAKVTSNVKNGAYDETTKIFSIADKVESNDNQKSIIVTFETQESIQSSAFLAPTSSSNYDGCAIVISPNLPPSQESNSEFIFVVDCSGSMGGNSIKKAAECLELFIRSLPPNSYFNVVRFGSSFEKLFDSSREYSEQSAEEAIQLAQNLKSNLGGTNIYNPLDNIYQSESAHGQRQIFIMTDGEVNDVESVLELISRNSNKNRCFTIGIGRGCDAGLVEGMANASGGKSDFVQEGDSISEKVIPQLQSSLHPSLTSIEIHIEGNDSFETSPYPLPSINSSGANVVYLRDKSKGNTFEGGILITGAYGKESIEIPIEDVIHLQNSQEDKYGCSGGKNIGNAILPLFSFSILQSLDRKRKISDEDKAKAVELSISSGVLCKYTGYVGMTEGSHRRYDEMDCCCCAAPMMRCCCAAPMMNCCCAAPKMAQCCRAQACVGCAGGAGMRSAPKKHMKCCCAAEELRAGKLRAEDELRAAACRPKQEEKEEPLPTKYDLMTIARYQKITGYWDNLNAINSMIGKNINHIEGIDVSDKSLESNCIATILAIAVIHVRSANEKNSWLMIEQKAIEWLKKTLPNVNVEEIIAKTESLI